MSALDARRPGLDPYVDGGGRERAHAPDDVHRDRKAHRVVGYFEEEAVTSYTLYLQEIDEGRSPNVPAPAIARHYWKMADDATLRDVVLVVRDDEAHHRDVNHGFASTLGGTPRESTPVAPYPNHATELSVGA